METEVVTGKQVVTGQQVVIEQQVVAEQQEVEVTGSNSEPLFEAQIRGREVVEMEVVTGEEITVTNIHIPEVITVSDIVTDEEVLFDGNVPVVPPVDIPNLCKPKRYNFFW